MINISELVDDPDFAQPNGINITRTFVKIENHSPVETKKKINVRGIITINSENEDDLLSSADRNSESINIFTYERLKTVGIDKIDGKNYLSDIVHFNGNDYVVRKCFDDAQYGFCKSVAAKMEQDIT